MRKALQTRIPACSAFARMRVRWCSALPNNMELVRTQHFKDHVFELHSKDPDRWTPRALSRHFSVPLSAMQALLALEGIASEKGELDGDLCELARDAETLLRDEFFTEDDEKRDGKGSKGVGGEYSSLPAVTLDEVDPQQEAQLFEAFSQRFRLEEAATAKNPSESPLVQLLSAVSLEDLRALKDHVAGGETTATDAQGGGATAGVAAESVEEKDERGLLLREILGLVAPDLRDEFHAPSLRLDELRDLTPVVIDDGASGATLHQKNGVPVHSQGLVKLNVGGVTESSQPKLVIVPDKGPDPSAYVSQSQLLKLHRVRQRDPGEQLALNLKNRHRVLTENKQDWFKRKGIFVFTEIIKKPNRYKKLKRRGEAYPMPTSRVWAWEKGTPRAATPDEVKRGMLKYDAPVFTPRIQRNW